MAEHYIPADPYPWPYNGDLRPANTALLVIDMQTDLRHWWLCRSYGL
jgi:hypothetical protein